MDASIPPELLLPTPRMLRRRADAPLGRFATVLLIIFVPIPLALSVWAVVEPILISNSLIRDAVVTKLQTSHGSKGHVTYLVGYRYPLAGRDYSDSESVDWSIYRQLGMDQPVQVRVFQSALWQTSWLQLLWQHYAAERYPMWVAAALFDTVLLLIGWSIGRQRRLLRTGTPTLGQVVSKRVNRGKSPSYWVTYQFKPASGGTIQKSTTITRDFYERYEPGESLCVVYDPNHPKRAVLYGALWFECAESRAQ